MAQITAPHAFTAPHPGSDLRRPDPRRPDPRRPDTRRVDPAADASRREHLRSILPVALAVALLLGVVVTGGYLLRDLLDFGVWFLSQP